MQNKIISLNDDCKLNPALLRLIQRSIKVNTSLVDIFQPIKEDVQLLKNKTILSYINHFKEDFCNDPSECLVLYLLKDPELNTAIKAHLGEMHWNIFEKVCAMDITNFMHYYRSSTTSTQDMIVTALKALKEKGVWKELSKKIDKIDDQIKKFTTVIPKNESTFSTRSIDYSIPVNKERADLLKLNSKSYHLKANGMSKQLDYQIYEPMNKPAKGEECKVIIIAPALGKTLYDSGTLVTWARDKYKNAYIVTYDNTMTEKEEGKNGKIKYKTNEDTKHAIISQFRTTNNDIARLEQQISLDIEAENISFDYVATSISSLNLIEHLAKKGSTSKPSNVFLFSPIADLKDTMNKIIMQEYEKAKNKGEAEGKYKDFTEMVKDYLKYIVLCDQGAAYERIKSLKDKLDAMVFRGAQISMTDALNYILGTHEDPNDKEFKSKLDEIKKIVELNDENKLTEYAETIQTRYNEEFVINSLKKIAETGSNFTVKCYIPKNDEIVNSKRYLDHVLRTVNKAIDHDEFSTNHEFDDISEYLDALDIIDGSDKEHRAERIYVSLIDKMNYLPKNYLIEYRKRIKFTERLLQDVYLMKNLDSINEYMKSPTSFTTINNIKYKIVKHLDGTCDIYKEDMNNPFINIKNTKELSTGIFTQQEHVILNELYRDLRDPKVDLFEYIGYKNIADDINKLLSGPENEALLDSFCSKLRTKYDVLDAFLKKEIIEHLDPEILNKISGALFANDDTTVDRLNFILNNIDAKIISLLGKRSTDYLAGQTTPIYKKYLALVNKEIQFIRSHYKDDIDNLNKHYPIDHIERKYQEKLLFEILEKKYYQHQYDVNKNDPSRINTTLFATINNSRVYQRYILSMPGVLDISNIDTRKYPIYKNILDTEIKDHDGDRFYPTTDEFLTLLSKYGEIPDVQNMLSKIDPNICELPSVSFNSIDEMAFTDKRYFLKNVRGLQTIPENRLPKYDNNGTPFSTSNTSGSGAIEIFYHYSDKIAAAATVRWMFDFLLQLKDIKAVNLKIINGWAGGTSISGMLFAALAELNGTTLNTFDNMDSMLHEIAESKDNEDLVIAGYPPAIIEALTERYQTYCKNNFPKAEQEIKLAKLKQIKGIFTGGQRLHVDDVAVLQNVTTQNTVVCSIYGMTEKTPIGFQDKSCHDLSKLTKEKWFRELFFLDPNRDASVHRYDDSQIFLENIIINNVAHDQETNQVFFTPTEEIALSTVKAEPCIRYLCKDQGKAISKEKITILLKALIKDYVLNGSEQAVLGQLLSENNIKTNHIADIRSKLTTAQQKLILESLDRLQKSTLKLPFLFIQGRSDGIVVQGVNIFQEQVMKIKDECNEKIQQKIIHRCAMSRIVPKNIQGNEKTTDEKIALYLTMNEECTKRFIDNMNFPSNIEQKEQLMKQLYKELEASIKANIGKTYLDELAKKNEKDKYGKTESLDVYILPYKNELLPGDLTYGGGKLKYVLNENDVSTYHEDDGSLKKEYRNNVLFLKVELGTVQKPTEEK